MGHTIDGQWTDIQMMDGWRMDVSNQRISCTYGRPATTQWPDNRIKYAEINIVIENLLRIRRL